MNIVKVVGAIASKSAVTLYLETGEEIPLPKDTYRTSKIVDTIAPGLALHQTVALDLDNYSAEIIVEERTGGFIKFITSKVKKWFGVEGSIREPRVEMEVEETSAIVMGKTIPGMEKLKTQIEAAAYGTDTKGFEIFMSRLAAIIDTRGHTVQELLTFMERADLPIADDGSIVAYKVLCNSKSAGVFVDPHTRSVQQRLGSHVSMPVDMVDQSRRTECSTGLHVARRAYLRTFSADVATLIKIAPEDVVAVPFGEPDKMRVCGYHIVAILNDKAYELLLANRSMTSDDKSARQLADVIIGNHVGILDTVRIGGPKGTDVKTETLAEKVDITPSGKSTQTVDVVTKKPLDLRQINKNVETIRAAAISGDMSAALSVEDEKIDTSDIPEQEKEFFEKAKLTSPGDNLAKVQSAPKKKRKAPVAPVPEPVTVAPAAVKPLKPFDQLPVKHREALALIKDGLSQREVANQISICRKTLRKLIKAGYTA